jgi:signal transduction histidine kinase/CheY-like chemotaxis protein
VSRRRVDTLPVAGDDDVFNDPQRLGRALRQEFPAVTSILNPPIADHPPEQFMRGRRWSAGRTWIGFAAFALLLVVNAWRGDGVASMVNTAIGGLGFLPLNLGAIYWLWRASSNMAHAAGERQGLRLLAAMYIATAAGNLSWAYQDLVSHDDPHYGWANLVYLSSYIIGAIGLSRFPIAPTGVVALRKLALDIACIVIAVLAMVWTFVVAPLDPGVPGAELFIQLSYPLGCIMMLAFIGRLLMRQGANRQHSDFAVLAIALFVQCTVDLVLELDYRNQITELTSWSAAICPLAYALIIYTAERSALRTTSEPDEPLDPSLNPINLVPTIAGITVYAVLIWAAQSNRRDPLGVLVASAILLNVLFLAKQAIAVRENARLLAARAESESRARYAELAREGQKLEAIGRLAGGIAHDFNNLLTTVLANSEFALTRLRPGDLAHEEVSDIRSAAMRGADLIRQLLAFSRKSVVAPVRLQPDLVLREMERLLQRLAGDRCKLLLELPADLGMVQMDRGQLEQVMANLVTNARDAMPDGGAVVITGRNVTLDTAAATVLALPVGDYVSLAVQDNGVGIAADVRRHIFEPFFSTKAPGKGTGLGLASTYGIMRQSNGGVDVQSEPGHGSCFTLYLPRVYVEAALRAPVMLAPANIAHASQGETILLVEDEVAVRQVTRRMLTSDGYNVLTAGDAVAARAMFDQHGDDIALMISDVMMPGESGPELATRMRERWPNLTVLFISGYSNSELPDDGNVDAADDFLQKPFTGAQLLARVDARLHQSHRPSPTSVRSR